MRLAPRGQSQHLHAPWFLRQHLHMGCSWCMERVKFNSKDSQRAERKGSRQRCFQSAQFVPRATRSESKGKGKCLTYWPQIHRGFHLRKEECQKHFASHEKKIPAQKLTTFLRRYSLAVNHQIHLRGSPEDSQPSREGGKEGRKREEETGPRNVHTRVSAYPSLGLCQIKKDQMISASAGECVCSHTHKFSPCLHLITLNALLIIHSPNTKRPPPQPAPPPQLRLSFPTDLPRARNKLPIICIMLHDSLLHASNHFSISFRKNPSRIILSKLN